MVEGLCELDLIVEERSLTKDEKLKKEEYFFFLISKQKFY
jgi:hypothetical protein